MFARNVQHKWIYLLFVLGNLLTLGKLWYLFVIGGLVWVCSAPRIIDADFDAQPLEAAEDPKMNSGKYTIYLDTFHGLMLQTACQRLAESMARQLEEEEVRRRKWWGLFYTPTPGIFRLPLATGVLHDVRRTILTKLKNCSGELVVDGLTANLLMAAVTVARQTLAESPDCEEKTGGIEAFNSLTKQLPFNEEQHNRITAWFPLTRELTAASKPRQ